MASADDVALETFLLELSARFVGLDPDRLDEGIQQAQRQICEILDFDRSSLLQHPANEPDVLMVTHLFQRDVMPARPSGRIDATAMFPWCAQQLNRGQNVCITDAERLPPEASRDIEMLRQVGTRSLLAVALPLGRGGFGAVTFASTRARQDWPDRLVRRLELVAEVFGNAVARARSEKALRESLEEVQRLRNQLHEQNVYLQEEVKLLNRHSRLLGRSEALQRVLMRVEQVAPTGSTVLLLGETGTGKELVASAIHDLSPRRNQPMVRLNCSAIPASLIESELFGREKGAYTGAASRQAGRFEIANGTTLFLDEIGELPAEIQVKLLRVLQEKQIERLGSSKTIPLDVRIIAATNRDLEKAVSEGSFREDLYYRLNVFPITVPPLRDRPEDLPVLVSAFVAEFSAAFGKNVTAVSKDSIAALGRYHWPGNVRELRNVIERAMILANGSTLQIDPPGQTGSAVVTRLELHAVEREHILRVLRMTGWRVRGSSGAAEMLDLRPTTLESRMAKLGIRRPASRPQA